MSKRKYDTLNDDNVEEVFTVGNQKKHTLDSDEEDSGDDEKYNIMDENDIEGEETGIAAIDDDIKITPFNMKEELEEGHFDKDGHYQFDKTKEIKDSWLDTIDWIKVKTKDVNEANEDSLDSETSKSSNKFDIISRYKQIIDLMKPGESVKKSIQRIGGSYAKLSSAERWKQKKAGIVDNSSELVIKLTELCNEILTETGNMDIYEEKYEHIKKIINNSEKKSSEQGTSKSSDVAVDLDMYADDFDVKEKQKLKIPTEKNDAEESNEIEVNNIVTWEFKWKEEDSEIHGPFNSEQMQIWVDEGYFKDGVLVRKTGSEDQKFYTSKRIDFELYL